jgi:hypothetical protein
MLCFLCCKILIDRIIELRIKFSSVLYFFHSVSFVNVSKCYDKLNKLYLAGFKIYYYSEETLKILNFLKIMNVNYQYLIEQINLTGKITYINLSVSFVNN